MRVISAKQIRNAQLKWPHSASALDEWYRKVKVLNPEGFAALKLIFPAVDKVGALPNSAALYSTCAGPSGIRQG